MYIVYFVLFKMNYSYLSDKLKSIRQYLFSSIVVIIFLATISLVTINCPARMI